MTKKTINKPKFSIVMVDYDQSVNRDYMRRAVQCLMVQTYTEFEVILLHDGPKEIPYDKELNLDQLNFIDQIIITEQRFNNWGHTLRDMGIRAAKGDYIVQFNADNVIKNDNSILIFSIYMRGVVFCNGAYSRRVGEEDTYSTIMTGIPTRFRNIDCMQLVMKREKWLAENGWHDKSRNSDGIMYPGFVTKYGARYIPELLGEHW